MVSLQEWRKLEKKQSPNSCGSSLVWRVQCCHCCELGCCCGLGFDPWPQGTFTCCRAWPKTKTKQTSFVTSFNTRESSMGTLMSQRSAMSGAVIQPNLFGSQVCLLSHTPAFLKRGNFLSHHENSKKPDNYCNDSNRWKSSVQYHLKSKSEYFLACFANAFCNRKIWLQQGNTILVRKHWDYSCFFFKGEKKSQRNITNTCKAVNIYSHHDWSIAVTLGWNRSL